MVHLTSAAALQTLCTGRLPSGTTFAFLPEIVCWSTFRVFGGSPVLGLILGLMLVNGFLPNAYSVADPSSGVTPLMLFGFIPIVG